MRYWRKHHPLPNTDLKAVMVVATYRQPIQMRVLLGSLLGQTYPNLKVIVVHDGPWDPPPYSQGLEDEYCRGRVLYVNTPVRENVFGHNCREFGRKVALSDDRDFGRADVVGFTNADNYYVPTYVESLISALNKGYDLAYCNLIHSHKLWTPMKTELKRGKIDCGAWLCRSLLVSKVSWQSSEFAEDWHYLSRLCQLKARATKVDGFLFVHN